MDSYTTMIWDLISNSLNKFIKNVSTGKYKDYTLKNFQFEKKLTKMEVSIKFLKRNKMFWFKLSKNQSLPKDQELALSFLSPVDF